MDKTMNGTPELYIEDTGIPINNPNYAGTTQLDGATAAGLFGGVMLIFVFMFALIVATVIAYWKIFTKAGKEGWKSLIPFYNVYVLLEISGKPGWWLIFFFIPIANLIVSLIMFYGLSKSFGKSIGYTLGLWLLSPLFLLMLAFGSATYRKPTRDGSDTLSKEPVL